MTKEWMVKVGAIMVVLYLVLFGMPRLARSYTVDELAYKYSGNPKGLVRKVNVLIPATPTNCKEVSALIYRTMKKGQYANLKLVGLWVGTKRGHAIVTYTDKWGKRVIITTADAKHGNMTVMLKYNGTIEDFAGLWDLNWTHYYEYRWNWTIKKKVRRQDE